MSQEITIGPTMFLLSTYQFMKFFLLLTFLNIPLYYVFNKTSDEELGTDIISFFAGYTLGTLGEGDPTCGSLNYATTQNEIELKCSHKLAKIEDITFVGISRYDESTCGSSAETLRLNAKDVLYQGCFLNYDTELREKSVSKQETFYLIPDAAKINKFLDYF